MGWFWLVFIIGWMFFMWPHLDRLGLGLVGVHESREGWFNLDIMIVSWITVGLLFLAIEMIF
jgi:hypothetical protein